ncbi:DinB family protein [Rubrivirga sp. IMCC45206]|uniref:DinB family protein n=1 Tax=Rubrivirga sp. IMCC45206 TaxID=3391614 RepID=UPI00398FA676
MTPLSTLARTALALALLSTAAQAQTPDAAPPESPVIASLGALHQLTSANITRTAQLLSEDLYAYRPTEEVRTAGGLLAHIANAQYLFCSSATGEANPNEANLEETLITKAETVAALAAAFAYCAGVYDAMSDAQGAEVRDFFGRQMAASGILAFNTTHNYEHYGNLVTYMRMNGIVPPSSQQ